jgi:hypothetical protein
MLMVELMTNANTAIAVSGAPMVGHRAEAGPRKFSTTAKTMNAATTAAVAVAAAMSSSSTATASTWAAARGHDTEPPVSDGQMVVALPELDPLGDVHHGLVRELRPAGDGLDRHVPGHQRHPVHMLRVGLGLRRLGLLLRGRRAFLYGGVVAVLIAHG